MAAQLAGTRAADGGSSAASPRAHAHGKRLVLSRAHTRGKGSVLLAYKDSARAVVVRAALPGLEQKGRQGERTDLQPPANSPDVSQTEAAQQLNVGEGAVRRLADSEEICGIR